MTMANLDEVNLDEFDFDSPDEPAGSAGRNNMNRRLVIAFQRMGENAFINRLDQIIAGMTGSTYLPEPWWTDPLEKPTAASLATDRTAYVAAMAAAADGDKTKIAARKTLRASLNAALKKLAQYIELKAAGDVEILE